MKKVVLKTLVCTFCLGSTIPAMAQELRPQIHPVPATIVATDPHTPISSLPYTISAPGSYTLTGNLIANGSTGGITISADNVTLDLNGFALIGGGSGSVAGINVPSDQKNIVIRNGTVRGWTNGGVNASNANNSVIEGLRVSNNSASSSFSNVAGISIGNGSTVKNCHVAQNTNCHGISVGSACFVTGCIAKGNSNVGIRMVDRCYVLENISDSNGTGITGGSGNRIEDNSCTSNTNAGVLISSGSTNNLIIRDSARNNSPNYNIATGNRYGTIVNLTPSSAGQALGDSAPSSVTSTDPWANFAY